MRVSCITVKVPTRGLPPLDSDRYRFCLPRPEEGAL